MTDQFNLEFVGQVKPKKLTSLDEDFKAWHSEILTDKARREKYGTNSAMKAALIESGEVEELTRERFPEDAYESDF